MNGLEGFLLPDADKMTASPVLGCGNQSRCKKLRHHITVKRFVHSSLQASQLIVNSSSLYTKATPASEQAIDLRKPRKDLIVD